MRPERSREDNVCTYELGEPEDWATDVATEFDQRLSQDGSTVILSGQCRRCRHDMSVELDIQGRTGKPVSATRRKVRLRGKDFVKLALCNCARDHEGRPDNRAGCGAHGALRIGEKHEATPSEHIVGVTRSPGTPVMPDLEWEWRVEQQEFEALPAMRAAGEKWTTAITSLTGVFGIVVLIKGPGDIGNVKHDVGAWLPRWAADEVWMVVLLVVAALLAVPAFFWDRRALRPALWLAAFVIGTLAFLALGQGAAKWRTVVMVSLAVAVTLASVSILAGARAAYGPLYRPVAASGDLLREQQRRELRHSRRWLLAAIYSAVCAILYIAFAIGVTWLQTP
jgi:hypothetical protein